MFFKNNQIQKKLRMGGVDLVYGINQYTISKRRVSGDENS